MKGKILLVCLIFCFISAGAQNIGIGITAPAFKLDVRGGSINTDSLYRIGGNVVLSVKGTANTFLGIGSGFYNSTGNYNTAIGNEALLNNSTGVGNSANGYRTLYSNSSGYGNTASGYGALSTNSSGQNNTADGALALNSNSGGNYNTAIGVQALYVSNEHYNTACGYDALYSTTASQRNSAFGYGAGSGYDHGYNNVFLGAGTGTNASGYYNVIAIGQAVTCTAPSQARIGNSSTGSIGGYANWSNISDGRYKKDINENVSGLDFIMKLRPVTYHLDVWGISKKLNESRDHEMDQWSKNAIAEKEKIIQSGFVAQEVEQAAKEVGYDFSGVDKPKNKNDFYGLRYAEFVVPLVKAMQQQQQQIEELKKKNEELKISNVNQKMLYEELLKRIVKLEHSSVSKN